MRTRDTLAPHLRSPFQLSASGAYVEVEEQDSPEDVRGCVYNVLVTPLGHRDELPSFGIPDPSFRLATASLEDVQDAVERNEPRAEVLLDEDPDYLDDLVRRVRVYWGL